jgi:predicted component of type VI protein secretion system
MPPKSPLRKHGKRAELVEWIARTQPQQIGEAGFAELLQSLAPISESYLRKLLRESGVPLAPMVEGVRQGSLDDLHRTLLALAVEYEGGNRVRRAQVRSLVITAKDHARWRGKKEEMLWLLTWLENPVVFPEWVKLRRATAAIQSTPL